MYVPLGRTGGYTMGRGIYYIGVFLVIMSVGLVIYQLKKDPNDEAGAKTVELSNSTVDEDKKNTNLLTNRDLDIIQMKGFEHENTSKKGQLREQFTISLHMAYIGVQSLNIKNPDSNETKEQVIEQNEETLNHVLKELQNAKDALDEDTIVHGKLTEIINKAKDINLENKDALKQYQEAVYSIDKHFKDTIDDKSHQNPSHTKLPNEKKWLDNMIDRIGSKNPYKFATQDDFDYYTAKYIRDYLLENIKTDNEQRMVKIEKARNLADQLMDVEEANKVEIEKELKKSLKQLK